MLDLVKKTAKNRLAAQYIRICQRFLSEVEVSGLTEDLVVLKIRRDLYEQLRAIARRVKNVFGGPSV